MKRFTRTGLGLLTLGALVVALAVGPALGDNAKAKPDATKKADVHLDAKAVTFNATAFKLMKRKAIKAKAFDRTKFKHKDDDLVTTPGGKKVKFKEYHAKLKELSEKLAEMGEDLQDGQKHAVLARSEIKVAELDTKAKKVTASHLKFDPKLMRAVVKREVMEKRHTEGAKKDEVRVAAVTKHLAVKAAPTAVAPAKVVAPKGTTKSWHWELGKRNLVAAALNAKLETSGNTERVKVMGEASADGYLANYKQTLIKATGTLTVPRTGDSKLTVAVNVLGRTVYNKNLAKKTAFTFKDTLSKSIDKSVSFRFQLGPIPLKVKMGARGTVGVRYFIGVRPMSAEAQFIPFVKAEAYAQCGVDLFVAGAGVGGKLRLIDFELRIGGELAVKFDQSNRPMLSEHAYVQSNISMLSGSLYVYAYINYLFGKKEYHWDLWKWKGFKSSGYLVNIHKTHNLF